MNLRQLAQKASEVAAVLGRQSAQRGPTRSRLIDKMDSLNGAASMIDLRSPPGNRLEALKGDLKGSHSIRVNDRWRLVFLWEGDDAHDVRLVDYH